MEHAGHCIPAALADLLSHQPLSPGKVTFAWRVAVGAAVDRSTSVQLLPDGTLDVVACDTHWKREVRRSAGLVRVRLNTLLGENIVTRISTRTVSRR